MTRPKCIKCKKGYKILTKEKLCAFCHKELKKTWPDEFTGAKEKKKKYKK